MEKREQLNAILWIALLYTAISSIFTLLTSTMENIYDLFSNNSQIGDRLKSFFGVNGLSITVAVIIVIVLIINIKKSNQTGYLEIVDKETVLFTTGILITIQGLIKLSTALPFFITMVQSLFVPELAGMWNKEGLRISIIRYAIPVIIIICQLILGIYITKYAKKKTVDTTALWIAILFTAITNIFSLIRKLSVLLFPVSRIADNLEGHLFRSLIWIVVVAITIILLTLKIKKSNQASDLNLLDEESIGLITGILIAIVGLIDLSTLLSQIIILSSLDTGGVQGVFKDILTLNTFSAVIHLCQIFVGVYLVTYYKKKIA